MSWKNSCACQLRGTCISRQFSDEQDELISGLDCWLQCEKNLKSIIWRAGLIPLCVYLVSTFICHAGADRPQTTYWSSPPVPWHLTLYSTYMLYRRLPASDCFKSLLSRLNELIDSVVWGSSAWKTTHDKMTLVDCLLYEWQNNKGVNIYSMKLTVQLMRARI